MRFIYIILAYLLVPLAFGQQLWRGLRDRDHWRGLAERFGVGYDRENAGTIWVHAVSVGEVQASAALVRALRARYPRIPLILTTVTPTGAQRASELFGGDVRIRYIPYDLPGCVRRFFDRTRPLLAVILETEIWPNLYHECGQRGVPLVLASARISPRSVNRYRLLVGLFRETLSHGIVIAAQSDSDAERFRSIGASAGRTHVTGNVKFDFQLSPGLAERGRGLREEHAGRRPVWIAGSTHDGEEEKVLDAHALVRREIPDALLVLVPRHRNRFESVAALLRRRGLSFVTRSSRERTPARAEVLLLDTLGELVTFYAASDVAFVGGSLVPIGGHNLLEPAALGLPILSGPHNYNGEDIARLLVEVGATNVVASPGELAAEVLRLLRDPAAREEMGNAGRRAVDENRGALNRLLTLIDPLVREKAPDRKSVV